MWFKSGIEEIKIRNSRRNNMCRKYEIENNMFLKHLFFKKLKL